MLESVSAETTAKNDLPILQRIYAYQKALNPMIDSLEDHVYAKARFNVEKRNIALQFIPSMYPIAKDPREYIRESYTKVLLQDAHHYDFDSRVVSSTIRKDRRAMSPLVDFLTPNIYDIALYEGRMFSPFNRHNRRYYRFSEKQLTDSTTWLEFRPKFYNTQLVNGYAVVATATGRIIMTMINGEFDMISFRTHIEQGDEGARSLMPKRCNTVGTFRFMGNRISTVFDADYHCERTLPDNAGTLSSREMMDLIRPIPLSAKDHDIYEAYDSLQQHEAQSDTIAQKTGFWRKVFWDTLGDNLIQPIEAESKEASIELSPIINPLYLSYSESRGLRYKMKLRTRYSWNQYRYLTLNPTFGYNFRQQQFYFTAPLRMTYNPKRNGYAEIVWGNGTPISNPSVKDMLIEQYPDTIDFENTDLDLFKDTYLQAFNNIMVFDWFDVETGVVYHRRTAKEKALMQQYGMPDTYRTFAPVLGLKFLPWLDRGPLIAINYERAIKGVLGSNLAYERWEIDAQWKKKIPGLRLLNLRAGGGLYTDKENDIFLDFTNFHDENLPEGWDDNWSGDFQLLSRREYNRSRYYIRGNISYESPMMFATWIPYLGKYIEKERFYLSGVQLERSRPYYELGYGFTNRYISVGLFASFRNTHFDEFGISFDFELFKRW